MKENELIREAQRRLRTIIDDWPKDNQVPCGHCKSAIKCLEDLTVSENARNRIEHREWVKESKLTLIDSLEPHLLRGNFTLRSGKKSSYYIDVKSALLNGAMGTIIEALWAKLTCIEGMLSKDIFLNTVFVGYGYGGAILCGGLASRLDVSTAVLRSERKEHGLGGKLMGCEIKQSSKVIIVEDVITTGGSVRECVDLLKETIGDTCPMIKTVVTVVNRMEEGDPRNADLSDLDIINVITNDDLEAEEF